MKQPANGREFMPQLDSLRTVAVLAVALHHWLTRGFEYPLVSGVHLFFVLSGFLITGILLDARKRNEAAQDSGLAYLLRAFYVRRFLRITPLYFAALAIATYFGVAGLRQTWPWHALYLSNYEIFLKNDWIGLVGHFWTLSVEEQFYLAWPLLVLRLPWAYLPNVFLAVAAGSVAFRWIGEIFFPGRVMWNLATPGYLDSFSLGALLAYQRMMPGPLYSAILRRSGSIIAVCFVLAVLRKRAVGWHLVFLDPLLYAIAYACLINIAANGARGPLGWVLSRPTLQYLGKISYGLYIAHNFAPIPVLALLTRFPSLWAIPRIQLFLMAIWTLAVAMLSWHLYEGPLNAFKKYFPYTRRSVAAPLPAQATVSKSTEKEA
jgi:peptidoglycan/LPS O-acetylase OafA/YrhL